MSLRWTEEEYEAFCKRREAGDAYGAWSAALKQGDGGRGSAGKPAGTMRMSADEFRKSGIPADGGKPKRRSKYGNRKVEWDGKKFDSEHEAIIYRGLKLRCMMGGCKCILRQVPFDLPGGIVYKADFVVIGEDMKIQAVIDAKSEATKKDRVYINKKKQIRELYGIEIVEM